MRETITGALRRFLHRQRAHCRFAPIDMRLMQLQGLLSGRSSPKCLRLNSICVYRSKRLSLN